MGAAAHFYIDRKASIFQLFGQILLVVICFYSPVFQPWYFLLVLPFFALTTTRTWLAYCIVVFTFSNFQAIAYAVPKSHWLHIALLAFVPIMAGSFFWKFKKHFIDDTLNQLIVPLQNLVSNDFRPLTQKNNVDNHH